MYKISNIENTDYVYKLDEFISHEYNILLITGISGSGKSTLAEEISDKLNTEPVIHLDNFEHGVESSCPFIKKYMKTHSDLQDNFDNHWQDLDGDYFYSEFWKYFEWVMSSIKNSKKQYILEGVQLLDDDFLKKHYHGSPLVVKGPNLMIAYKRLTNRKEGGDFPKHTLEMSKRLDNDRKHLIQWHINIYNGEYYEMNEGASSNDFEYHLDEWKHKETRFLFITGISGSGKSTQAKQLAEEYNAKLIELDTSIEGDFINSIGEDVVSKMNDHDYTNAVVKYVMGLYKSGQVIVEGVGFLEWFDHVPNLKQHACIIKKIRYMQSSLRAAKRDGKTITNTMKDLFRNKKAYDYYAKRIAKLRKMLGENVMHENTEIVNPLDDEILNESFLDVLANPMKMIPVLFKDKVLRPLASTTTKVNVDKATGTIEIQGINYNQLLARVRELYEERGLTNIFEKQYQMYDVMMYDKKKMKRADMNISYFKSYSFFALELVELFEALYTKYQLPVYGKIANDIYKKTWLSNKDRFTASSLDVTKLSSVLNSDYALLPHQSDFIRQYPQLKSELNLDGFMMTFKQGLGKTLTAVSLAELLGKQMVYIVCPNTVQDNWAYEIRSYLQRYNDEETFKNEVCVYGNSSYKFTDSTKYVIINNESIPKVFGTIPSTVNAMLILDESHNFRNVGGKRVNELIQLKKLLKCHDVLTLSGTPIKAAPSEVAPVLQLIDPLFTEEVAKVYVKCFAFDNAKAADIVKARFSKVMYQVSKAVLNLPPKIEHSLEWTCKDADKYLLETVRKTIRETYDKIYKENLAQHLRAKDKFHSFVNKYADSDRTEDYLDMCDNIVSGKIRLFDYHEIDINFFINFHKVSIIPNISNGKELSDFKESKLQYLDYTKSCMGKAIGAILPKARTQMFIDIYEHNKKELHGIITNNTHKVIIFSMMRGVVDHIHADLVKHGIGAVKIVGGSKNRMETIIEFKESDDIDAMVATSQTLSTGITLTEANKVFFFGAPWRSADYEQASDRTHRIGQTSIVDIYNIVLPSKKPNLSSRMKDILDWSSNMVGAMMVWDEEEDTIFTESTVDNDMDYDSFMYKSSYIRFGIHNETTELVNPLDDLGGTMETLYETALTTAERNKLPDSSFGIPSQRKYPIHDEEHIKLAIQYFNKVDEEHEEELAKNIIATLDKLNVYIHVGDSNRLKQYFDIPQNESASYLIEAMDLGLQGYRLENISILIESCVSEDDIVILEVADELNSELAGLTNDITDGDVNAEKVDAKISKLNKLFYKIRIMITKGSISAHMSLTLIERMINIVVTLCHKLLTVKIGNVSITLLPQDVWVLRLFSKLLESGNRRDSKYTRANLSRLINIYKDSIEKTNKLISKSSNNKGKVASLNRLKEKLSTTLSKLQELEAKIKAEADDEYFEFTEINESAELVNPLNEGFISDKLKSAGTKVRAWADNKNAEIAARRGPNTRPLGSGNARSSKLTPDQIKTRKFYRAETYANNHMILYLLGTKGVSEVKYDEYAINMWFVDTSLYLLDLTQSDLVKLHRKLFNANSMKETWDECLSYYEYSYDMSEYELPDDLDEKLQAFIKKNKLLIIAHDGAGNELLLTATGQLYWSIHDDCSGDEGLFPGSPLQAHKSIDELKRDAHKRLSKWCTDYGVSIEYFVKYTVLPLLPDFDVKRLGLNPDDVENYTLNESVELVNPLDDEVLTEGWLGDKAKSLGTKINAWADKKNAQTRDKKNAKASKKVDYIANRKTYRTWLYNNNHILLMYLGVKGIPPLTEKYISFGSYDFSMSSYILDLSNADLMKLYKKRYDSESLAYLDEEYVQYVDGPQELRDKMLEFFKTNKCVELCSADGDGLILSSSGKIYEWVHDDGSDGELFPDTQLFDGVTLENIKSHGKKIVDEFCKDAHVSLEYFVKYTVLPLVPNFDVKRLGLKPEDVENYVLTEGYLNSNELLVNPLLDDLVDVLDNPLNDDDGISNPLDNEDDFDDEHVNSLTESFDIINPLA